MRNNPRASFNLFDVGIAHVEHCVSAKGCQRDAFNRSS